MTQSLTWRYLSPEHVHKCLSAHGPEALYRAILDADAASIATSRSKGGETYRLLRTMYAMDPTSDQQRDDDRNNNNNNSGEFNDGGDYDDEGAPAGSSTGRSSSRGSPAPEAAEGAAHSVLYLQPYELQQRQVMLDLFFHLILKCREFQLSPEKTSAIVGIVAKTHAESMEKVLTLQKSYAAFGQILQLHAVHRPPFSTAVLTIEDAKMITDYVLSTYYRHYKLYLYVFTPRRVASVKAFLLSEGNHDVPPLLPPQTSAIPLQRYEAARTEIIAAEQAKLAAEERERRQRDEAMRQREMEEQNRIPPIPTGLQQQLSAIRANVVGLSVNKLDALESKLSRIEQRIAESQGAAQSGAAGGGGQPAGQHGPSGGGGARGRAAAGVSGVSPTRR